MGHGLQIHSDAGAHPSRSARGRRRWVQGAAWGGRRAARKAFTLPEVVVTMVVATLLLGAMGSAIVIASRGLPDRGGPGDLLAAASGTDRLLEDLRHALYITERTNTTVAFAIQDRTGDGMPDTVRYAWSGQPHGPLTRQFNGGPVETELKDVGFFNLSYDVAPATETVAGGSTATDVVAGSFVAGSKQTLATVNRDFWTGECFVPSLPAEASSWSLTSVTLWIAQDTSNKTLNVQLRKGNSSPLAPNLPPPEHEVQVSSSDLPSSISQYNVPFTGADNLAPGQAVCLVLTSNANKCAKVQLEGSGVTASDMALVTSPGNETWTSTSSQSLYFRADGRYTVTTPDIGITRRFATAVRIRLEGPTETARIDTSVGLLNRPEVLSAVWDADFKADPTGIELNQDGTPDWAAGSCGGFETGELSGGVWTAAGDCILKSRPNNAFAELTTIDAAFRNTASNGAGNGAAIEVFFDQDATQQARLRVLLERQGDATQRLYLLRYNSTTNSDTTVIHQIDGLTGNMIPIRLLIDPGSDAAALFVDGSHVVTRSTSRYTGTGNNFVRLRRVDSTAAFDRVRVRVGGIAAKVGNRAPAAVAAAAPRSGSAPLTVNFGSSSSTDPDGDSLTTAWEFGDNATGSGVTTAHTYATPGVYTARAAVTDGRGGWATASVLIRVE